MRVPCCWWWFSPAVMSDLGDTMDCSSPGSSVHGISQTRILNWVAISYSKDKGTTEDEMVGWHHRLNGDDFE